MNKISLLILSALVFTACNTTTTDTTDMTDQQTPEVNQESTETSEDSTMEMEEDSMDEGSMEENSMESSDMTDSDETTMETEESASMSPMYKTFTQADYEANLGKKPQVVYFHATWCPTCLELEKKINENLSSFPEGTMILQADFDTETALKKEYGVVSQTTLVVLDKDGNLSEKLVNPSTAKLKEAIQATL